MIRKALALIAVGIPSVAAHAQDASMKWFNPPAKWSAKGATLTLEVAPGKGWVVVREGYFPPGVDAQIGVMAAAPEGPGFAATFEGFSVEPAK